MTCDDGLFGPVNGLAGSAGEGVMTMPGWFEVDNHMVEAFRGVFFKSLESSTACWAGS